MKISTLLQLSILFICIVPLISADLIITEVLFDPLISETGGEAVELYNTGSTDINLSTYRIATASSLSDARLPNIVLPPETYFLVTDANWDERKDSPLFPPADYEEPITMSNSNSGVAILDQDDMVIDSVAWGDETQIDEIFLRHDPFSFETPGNSLQRTSLSSYGFVQAPPNLTSMNDDDFSFSIGVIPFSIIVQGNDSLVQNLSYFPENLSSFVLTPQRNTSLTISFTSTFEIIEANVTVENQTVSFVTSDDLFYTAALLFNSSFPSGDYTISTEIRTEKGTLTYIEEMTILPLLAYEIETTAPSCALFAGDSCTLESPQITNIGNTPLDFDLFLNSTEGINVSATTGAQTIYLGTQPETLHLSLDPLAQNNFSFSVASLSSQDEGNYEYLLYVLGKQEE